MSNLKKSTVHYSLYRNIRFLRQQRGWNQEYIANLINVSVAAFSKLEKGVVNISLSRLKQIAHIYEVTPIELLTMEDGINPSELTIQKKRLAECEMEIVILQRKIIELYEALQKQA